MISTEERELIEKELARIERAAIGFFPTPLHKLEHLSKELKVNLYIKRDDLTGRCVFGGNKIRKLEFLLGEALKQKATHIITYGAVQSNHAMQTAVAGRMYGFNPVLFLTEYVKPDGLRGNLLLDHLFDADIKIYRPEPNENPETIKAQTELMAAEFIKEVEENGGHCYEIPGGGATAVGSIGFVNGYLELNKQQREQGLRFDYIATATGSGGTLAGLAAGRKLLEDDLQIISFTVGPKGAAYPQNVADLAAETLHLLGSAKKVTPDELKIDFDFAGEGYEIPTKQASAILKRMATREGILLDPVYTAKAMSGVIDYIERGSIPPGSNVCFWHTGGAGALFAEAEMVGLA